MDIENINTFIHFCANNKSSQPKRKECDILTLKWWDCQVLINAYYWQWEILIKKRDFRPRKKQIQFFICLSKCLSIGKRFVLISYVLQFLFVFLCRSLERIDRIWAYCLICELNEKFWAYAYISMLYYWDIFSRFFAQKYLNSLQNE